MRLTPAKMRFGLGIKIAIVLSIFVIEALLVLAVSSILIQQTGSFIYELHKEIPAGWQRIINLLTLAIFGGIFLNIILLLLGFHYFRHIILLPLIRLKNAALKIGDGNLEERVNFGQQDEVGELGRAFNKMAENLKETTVSRASLLHQIEGHKKTVEKLRKAYSDLNGAQQQVLQSEKLASIGQMATGVAHEINNPLFAISGEAEMLLKDDNKDEETKEASKIILEQTNKIKSITKGLLEFSRRREPKIEAIDINDIAETSLSLLGYQTKSAGIEIIKKLDPNLPKSMGDSGQIQQVFLNIMLNAVQAMEKGGTLTIKTDCENITNYGRRNGDVFKFGQKIIKTEFTDTGPGMDEETSKKIFDPFFTTKKKSTGLGLSICLGIITGHKGLIKVYSKVGEGSTFVVLLPIHKGG